MNEKRASKAMSEKVEFDLSILGKLVEQYQIENKVSDSDTAIILIKLAGEKIEQHIASRKMEA